VENIFRVKRSHLVGKRFTDEEVETEARKWPRQQSKDFCAAGFDALVKRWDKCINVAGGYGEKYMFFKFRKSHVLHFISICDLFTDSPSYGRVVCDILMTNSKGTGTRGRWTNPGILLEGQMKTTDNLC
jgi:hypothetical protein